MAELRRYQFLPDMTPDEFEALKADILEHGGNTVPIYYDADGHIIDGHQRDRAIRELQAEGHSVKITNAMHIPADRTEDENIERALRLNMNRRNLTNVQKRDVVRKLLAVRPNWTDPRIATLCGVPTRSICNWRSEFGASAPAVREDAHGNSRPVTRAAQAEMRERIAAEIDRDPSQSNRAIAKSLGCNHRTVAKVRQAAAPEQTFGVENLEPFQVGPPALAAVPDLPPVVLDTEYRRDAADLILQLAALIEHQSAAMDAGGFMVAIPVKRRPAVATALHTIAGWAAAAAPSVRKGVAK